MEKRRKRKEKNGEGEGKTMGLEEGCKEKREESGVP